MKYGLLVKKVHFDGKRYATAEEIGKICRMAGITYKNGINYLIRTKHLVRVLKGFFYIKTLEERKAGASNANFFEAVARALEHKGVRWYFGFDTAVKLNNLTHEYFATDCIVSDRIFRSRSVAILGHNVRFIKLKKGLFGFGIISRGGINYSDIEKTLLDIAYIRKYRGIDDSSIRDETADLLGHANRKKLREYGRHYPLSVRRAYGL